MDAPPGVAAANAAARAMLRDHLRDYVERNGEDSSYEVLTIFLEVPVKRVKTVRGPGG